MGRKPLGVTFFLIGQNKIISDICTIIFKHAVVSLYPVIPLAVAVFYTPYEGLIYPFRYHLCHTLLFYWLQERGGQIEFATFVS